MRARPVFSLFQVRSSIIGSMSQNLFLKQGASISSVWTGALLSINGRMTHSPSLISQVGTSASTPLGSADKDTKKRSNLEGLIRCFKTANQDNQTECAINTLLLDERPLFKLYDGNLIEDCVSLLDKLLHKLRSYGSLYWGSLSGIKF